MANVQMIVGITKEASINRKYMGVQGEQVSIDVTVDADIQALGYSAFIDFLRSDGSAYYRGPYDCSSGAFTFSLGAYDNILDKDGRLLWQFVIAEVVGTTRVVHWAAFTQESVVKQSIRASESAAAAYIPQMIWPTTYPASNISIADAGNLTIYDNVEDLMQDILARIIALETP